MQVLQHELQEIRIELSCRIGNAKQVFLCECETKYMNVMVDVAHRECQLLDLSYRGKLLHAGQDGFDPTFSGEGNPPIVLKHEKVGEPQCADHKVFGGGTKEIH